MLSSDIIAIRVTQDTLATGWTVRGSNPGGGGRDSLHPYTSALGSTQPPVQWVPVLFTGGKTAAAWR